MPKAPKPTVGFFDLAGCNGCLLSVVFNEDELLDILGHIDITAFRLAKGKAAKKYDIIFLEGLVASNDDLERVKEIRESTKILVALGTCAATGCIPAYRNWTEPGKYANMVYDRKKELKDVQPLPVNKFVKVDATIPGCPPDKKHIKQFIKDALLGKVHADHDRPVCFECRLNENRCLLDDGKLCLGPITRGGCNSICTNGGWECWGCRGHTPDANIEVMTKLLQEKGFKKAFIERRMKSFVGLEMEEPPKQKMPKPLSIKKAVKPAKKTVKAAKKVKVTKKVKAVKKVKIIRKVKAVKKVKKSKKVKAAKKPASKAGKAAKKPVKIVRKSVKSTKKTKTAKQKAPAKMIKKAKQAVKSKTVSKTTNPVKPQPAKTQSLLSKIKSRLKR